MVSGSLADIEQPSMRRRQIQNIVGDEPIVEEEVGVLDHPQRLHRQQLRVAGPRPDQEHVPGAPPLLPRTLAAPLLLQNPQQPLQLRQLERNVVVSGRIGAGVGRDRARGEMGVAQVHPAVPQVPLGGVPFGEGGRRRSIEAWEGEHSRSQRRRRGRGEEGGVGDGAGRELSGEESHGWGEWKKDWLELRAVQITYICVRWEDDLERRKRQRGRRGGSRVEGKARFYEPSHFFSRRKFRVFEIESINI